MLADAKELEQRIAEFKKRLEFERDHCEILFMEATVRLLAYKYAYYVVGAEIVKDAVYDLVERSWYIMGRALERLEADETSPCVDFDHKHPLAHLGIKLYHQIK